MMHQQQMKCSLFFCCCSMHTPLDADTDSCLSRMTDVLPAPATSALPHPNTPAALRWLSCHNPASLPYTLPPPNPLTPPPPRPQGYGFLSENAGFVEICRDHGMEFIGPLPQHIRVMGDKSTARDTMKKAGVPTVPGSKGLIADDTDALNVLQEVGLPLMIKATAGGWQGAACLAGWERMPAGMSCLLVHCLPLQCWCCGDSAGKGSWFLASGGSCC
jgi:hypothetical protein